jgi:glycosyltransferase involved in cell wall biosynthesis
MAKLFQRALFLCAGKYSLYNSLLETINLISEETKGFDIRGEINPLLIKVQTQMFRFPHKIRNRWESRLFLKANDEFLNDLHSYKPDVVFVYNSEYLLPGTCIEIKKTAKLVFYMGDSPFFTPLNPYYLTCLTYADLILCPDTFWISQLNVTGINRTAYFVPGIDTSSYFTINDQEKLNEIEETDILYTGSCYNNSWGFKKALLMSQFTQFNFKLYGNRSWKKWFSFFPELEEHFTEADFIPTERLNRMFNRSKLMPVDGNPAILNGFHIRLLEALGSGVLPLVEYRKDVDEMLFSDCSEMVPLIKDYRQAGDLAGYYIKNEAERSGLVNSLREYVGGKYNKEKNADRLSEMLSKNSGI